MILLEDDIFCITPPDMDGMARLEDGCRQVPATGWFQENVLFIVMLQGSAASALSPSDMSIIQPAHECAESGLQV